MMRESLVVEWGHRMGKRRQLWLLQVWKGGKSTANEKKKLNEETKRKKKKDLKRLILHWNKWCEREFVMNVNDEMKKCKLVR